MAQEPGSLCWVRRVGGARWADPEASEQFFALPPPGGVGRNCSYAPNKILTLTHEVASWLKFFPFVLSKQMGQTRKLQLPK